ncbi:Uncharacterised protein [Vibrio cholerae]|nr:Uncharacterised protein [Vibrio cholerae]
MLVVSRSKRSRSCNACSINWMDWLKFAASVIMVCG